MSEHVPYFWSAGGGKGWPQKDVIAALEREFGFPHKRTAHLWRVGEPFPRNSGGLNPIIITCDPIKASILAMSDQDWIYIPSIMPPPTEPPPGHAELYAGAGDPYLLGYD